jgi:acyl-CoA synthetase (AMP-forming)/AMP-acid ligase II
MSLDFLRDRWRSYNNQDAIVWNDQPYSYGWLLDRLLFWNEKLCAEQVARGTVTILQGDFSPNAVALFVALASHGCILVPITGPTDQKTTNIINIAQGEFCITLDKNDEVEIQRLDGNAHHPLYEELRNRNHPGLVLFSSGSTGEPKAAVHDLVPLLEKFKVLRHRLRTISFLLYDHIGGINTMLYTLANGGCLVTIHDRNPDAVLQAVENHRVELLPTSPTFLNLMLLSESYRRYDLSSLQTITYGTEPMSDTVLKRLHQLFPHVALRQTYGLSEVGILRSKSSSSDSLWIKIGGEGYETRIVDSILEIKAKSAMLGYLNFPTPFTADGWFTTGDAVEVQGDYLRILGRKSEQINVGGEKVFPTEIENVILELPSVANVTVYGEKNAITGEIVCADITPAIKVCEPEREFVTKIKEHCRSKLQRYKVPVRINIVDDRQYSDRFKKVRR